MAPGFFDRLVSRIDRIDPESLQVHMLRLARERGLLETIFQTIQEGVLVLDNEGRLSYANRAAERLLGFEAEKTRGRSMARYLHDFDWERLTDVRDDLSWKHLLSREIEISYPEHRFLHVYAAPLAEQEAMDRGVLIILRDITRDRELEASLLEGERLNAVKLLAAGVAHEIGNPLNALNIHLQLLARELEPLAAEQRKSLEELVTVARNEVSRLDVIITQFLRAVRPARPELELADPSVLLQETLRLLHSEIEDRRIEISVTNAKSVAPLFIDPRQIKQVFFNLVKNAFEAMPDGGMLAITFAQDNLHLIIDFLDNGSGIAAAELGRIFEPYHSTKAKGSGLGLMIVQRIVQDHGGQIEISSKPQSGTRFRIMLPLAEQRRHMLKSASAALNGAAAGERKREDK